MAKRLILGKKGSDYGLFVSEPGTNVDSITNVKDFAFTTSDSGYKGNFLMQKNINENNPASTSVTATVTSDSSLSKANTFQNRGIDYVKTSDSFKVTALSNIFE